MTIRHLRIFITVYEVGNMTLAADKLFMTQPSVSQAIKELEAYYGVILFERLSRKIYATESGEKLYQYALHIINLFDELGDSLKDNTLHRKLLIGTNYTVGEVLIHKYIGIYKSTYPDAEILVTVNKSSILLEMLRKNELDFALIEEIKNAPDMIEEFFYKDRIVIVASPDHPIFSKENVTVQDLLPEQFLLREKGSGARNLFDATMNAQGFLIKPYWESTSTRALINAAINKMGIAVLPYQLIKEYTASGSLKELLVKDIELSRNLAIVHHKHKYVTTAMQDFIDICHHS